MPTNFNPTGGIHDCTNFALRKASRAITQMYDQTLSPLGLKITQFSVLVTAARQGPMPVARMAEALGMDRTTLSRNLKPLVRNEWLEMIPGQDQRERLVQITADGQATLDAARPLWLQAQSEIHAALGDTVWQRLMGDLATVTATAPPP